LTQGNVCRLVQKLSLNISELRNTVTHERKVVDIRSSVFCTKQHSGHWEIILIEDSV